MSGKNWLVATDDLRSFSRKRIGTVAARLEHFRTCLIDIHAELEDEFALTGAVNYVRVADLRTTAMSNWNVLQRGDLPVLACVLSIEQLSMWWDLVRLSLSVTRPSQFDDGFWDVPNDRLGPPIADNPAPFLLQAVLIADSCLTYLTAAASSRSGAFIGSSREGLPYAMAIRRHLAQAFNVAVWNEGVFRIGATIIESLEAAAQSFEIGILVLTLDDEIVTRGKSRPAFRDNMLFECGLFIGAMSRRRTFIVAPGDAITLLPSDFSGIVVAVFDPNEQDLTAAVADACAQIRTAAGSA